ncbi:hypothetical protein Hanom_Chr00s000003g01604551 [Helianthus anomalus]
MALRIELNKLPYVDAFPCSMASIKQYVIAPVDVIFDKACIIRGGNIRNIFECKSKTFYKNKSCYSWDFTGYG